MRYGSSFALLALGGLGYSVLQATVWIFAALAVAAGITAGAVCALRVTSNRRPGKPVRVRYATRPPSSPRAGAHARAPSRPAIDRQYLAVVAAEIRRLGQDYRATSKPRR